MLAPVRKTRHVDLMRDDLDRLLDATEASALLHVKTKTLYAWVSRNKIPYRKVCSLVLKQQLTASFPYYQKSSHWRYDMRKQT